MSEREENLPPILPVGTKVVARGEVRGEDGRVVLSRGAGGTGGMGGAVGVVVRSPGDVWHSYWVRFLDGVEVSMKRGEMAVLARWQEGEVAGAGEDLDLLRFVILKCVIGSRAYGLDDSESDVDRRGVYLPPAEMEWGLYGVPEQLDRPETQECYWELKKFLMLALKANPNVLECLYTPLVEEATALGRELVEMRGAFLSKLVYQTYNGYVLSQFKKMQGDVRNKGEVKWKHVMHLLRVLIAGISALRNGELEVRVGEHRERLLAVKRGEVEMADVEEWRLKLHAEFEAAAGGTGLPEWPDYGRVNAFLVRARGSMV